MVRLAALSVLMLAGAAADAQPARPARPFGAEPAWPTGGISDVPPQREAVRPTRPRQPTPATRVQRSTRVRAPYAPVEQPAPADLEAVRRDQRARLRDPADWRRGMLSSEQDRRSDTTSRFRETPTGPEGFDLP